MAKAVAKLVRWRARLLELEFSIVHYASVKRQAVNGLLLLKTRLGSRVLVDNEVSVLPVFSKSLACVLSTVESDLETVEEPSALFSHNISEACLTAGVMKNEEAEITNLFEFIAAQSTDSNFRVKIRN